VTPSRSIRRTRLGIVPGCDYRRIEQIQMDAEGGGGRKDAARAGRGELVAEVLVERDPKELDAKLGSGAIVGIRIADKG
jgi:hypothetical protein